MRAFVDVLSARQETPSKIPYSTTPYELCNIYETGKVRKDCFWRDVALRMNSGEKDKLGKLREWAQKHYKNCLLNQYAEQALSEGDREFIQRYVDTHYQRGHKKECVNSCLQLFDNLLVSRPKPALESFIYQSIERFEKRERQACLVKQALARK